MFQPPAGQPPTGMPATGASPYQQQHPQGSRPKKFSPADHYRAQLHM
jgi:hypothetical protein